MKTAILEHMPAWYFARYRKPLSKSLVDQAEVWAQRAGKQIRRDALKEFLGRGFRIDYHELSVGTTFIRARLNLTNKELLIDPKAEMELAVKLSHLGFPQEPSPKDLILGHELFHLFSPRCPNALAELAAHIFCANLLNLDYFPGLLDLDFGPNQQSQAC